MDKCYACGREINRSVNQCPYCKFPVISTTSGAKGEEEKIRQFAAEYRKTNPQYFPGEQTANVNANPNEQELKKTTNVQTVSDVSVPVAADGSKAIAASEAKRKSTFLAWLGISRDKNALWVGATILVILLHEYLILGAFAYKKGYSWIPFSFTGEWFYDEFHYVVRYSWSQYVYVIEDICFDFADTLSYYWNGFQFVLISFVLGLGNLFLARTLYRQRKLSLKILCTAAFWILFSFYLHLIICVPAIGCSELTNRLDLTAFAVAAVINILFVICIVRVLFFRLRISLFDTISIVSVSVLNVGWAVYLIVVCADMLAFIIGALIDLLLLILIVRIILSQIFPGSGKNPVKYIINRIRMKHNEVVEGIVSSVQETNPEKMQVYEDGIALCRLDAKLNSDTQDQPTGNAGEDKKKAAENVLLPQDIDRTAGVEKVIRYADYEYDRKDDPAIRAFTDLLVLRTGQYVKTELEQKHTGKKRTKTDGYTFALVRQDLVPPEPKPEKKEKKSKLKKW